VVDVLAALLSTVDAFEPKMLLRDNADFVAVFTIKLGEHTMTGMITWHINESGLVGQYDCGMASAAVCGRCAAETRSRNWEATR